MMWIAQILQTNRAGKVVCGCGSFNTILVDGRLRKDSAVMVARDAAKKTAQNSYIGFTIKRAKSIVHKVCEATLVDVPSSLNVRWDVVNEGCYK